MVTGEVKAYVTVSPERVRITGRVGEALSQDVRIVPNDGKALTIKNAKARSGDNIDVAFKPLNKASNADGYLLTVTVTKKDAGGFGDTVVLETDLKERPTIYISVSGRLYDKTGATGKN